MLNSGILLLFKFAIVKSELLTYIPQIMSNNDILNLSPKEVCELVSSWGLKRYLTDQILVWLYRKRVASFDEMTNITKAIRQKLEEGFFIGWLEIVKTLESNDGTEKYLFKLQDGEFIEGVLMPIKGRLTLCVSTQVGCAMGCKFCRTGELKLKRNLTPSEIVGQYLEVSRVIAPPHPDPLPKGERAKERGDILRATRYERRITNIVFMGMGEPFHNYDNVIRALKVLTDQNLCAVGKNKITLSTCGLVPEIERFKDDSNVKLAVSLNAATDKVRSELMPINKRYPLDKLIEACKKYTKGNRHKVTFEYVMFGGVNDSMDDAKELVRLISNTPCKINLIPFNSYPGTNYKGPSEDVMMNFYQYLYAKGFQINIRRSKGQDISGACGQLCPTISSPSP